MLKYLKCLIDTQTQMETETERFYFELYVTRFSCDYFLIKDFNLNHCYKGRQVADEQSRAFLKLH